MYVCVSLYEKEMRKVLKKAGLTMENSYDAKVDALASHVEKMLGGSLPQPDRDHEFTNINIGCGSDYKESFYYEWDVKMPKIKSNGGKP